jgi:hypothetical protein
MTMSWLRVGGFVLVGGCGLPAAFPCEVESECVDGGRLGLCQPDGWCSFPDDGCGSGQRYGAHAGDGLAGLCVGEPGTTGASAEGTSAVDTNDPSIASFEVTGPIDGGETSTSADDVTTSGATVITTSPASDTGGVAEAEAEADSAASGGVISVCGDGIMDGGEQCDGADLDEQTCASLLAGTGVLGCTADCEFDVSMCTPNGGDYGPCDFDDECEASICQGFAGNGTCLPTCEIDSDCPPLEDALAPVCSIDGFCLIPCTVEEDCPEPMRCDESVYGLVCLW